MWVSTQRLENAVKLDCYDLLVIQSGDDMAIESHAIENHKYILRLGKHDIWINRATMHFYARENWSGCNNYLCYLANFCI